MNLVWHKVQDWKAVFGLVFNPAMLIYVGEDNKRLILKLFRLWLCLTVQLFSHQAKLFRRHNTKLKILLSIMVFYSKR